MADELQRVGLVFKADGTVDFTKSLKEVNASIKENYSAFKLAQSQWNESTKASAKLKDQQEYLSKEVKDYTDKVKLLKGQLDELSQKETKNAEKITKKKEQLEAAKNTAESYKKKCNDLKSELEKLEKSENSNSEAIEKKKKEVEKAEKAFSDYSSRAEKLESDIEKINASEANNAAEIHKKRAKLQEAQATLNNYQKSLDEVNEKLKYGTANIEEYGKKLEETGDKISKAGKKISDAGSDLTKKVTLPVAGLATTAVKTAADFDSEMSKVAAISGATGKDMDDLREKAREMGAKTKFSASEAAQGMQYMAMAGWKTQEMMDGLEGIMNLAAASGEDLASTSDIVTDALTAFGLSAKDSGHFADILAAASSNANTNVSMMGETFKYAAPICGSMGYSAEDTSVAIGLMANAGIKASQAGTSLRGALTNLAKPTDTVEAAMDRYGISLTDSSDRMLTLNELMVQMREKLGGLSEAEQTQAAAALFGKNAMSGMLAIINGSDADFEKLTNAVATCSDEVDGYNGQTERMAAVMNDNLSGQITILLSQLQELAIQFGEIMMPVIRDIVTLLQGFVGKLNEMDEGQRKTIITIGLIVAAIGPLLILIGKITTGIGGITSAIGFVMSHSSTLASVASKVMTGIGTGAKALFGIIAANPVIAIIVAIIATVVILYNKCEWFRNGVNKIFESIKNIVKNGVDKIKDFLDFEWKLPKIKMPKFDIIGKFSLNPPSVPRFDVSWNAKGAILNSPTIFGMNGDKFLGGGEAGEEAVLPIDLLRKYIREENKLSSKELIEALLDVFGQMVISPEISLYLGNEKISDVMTDIVRTKISNQQNMKWRSKGHALQS